MAFGLYRLGKGGLKVTQGARLFRSALQPFGKTGFTQAGRVLTKHPGMASVLNISKVSGNPAQINRVATDSLKHILRNGSRGTRHHARFGKIIEYRLSNGLGARFGSDRSFIGFLGGR